MLLRHVIVPKLKWMFRLSCSEEIDEHLDNNPLLKSIDLETEGYGSVSILFYASNSCWMDKSPTILYVFFRHHHHPSYGSWWPSAKCMKHVNSLPISAKRRSSFVDPPLRSASNHRSKDVGCLGENLNPSCQGSYVIGRRCRMEELLISHLWTRAFTMAHLGVLGSCGAATGGYPFT